METSKLNRVQSFFKSHNEEVTERIKSGKTKAFTCKEEAEKYAKKNSSYSYRLFCTISLSKHETIFLPYGYAVPK